MFFLYYNILYINFGERTQSIMEIQWYHRLSPADVGPEIACVNWETRIPKYGCTTKTATIDVKKQLQRVLVNNILFHIVSWLNHVRGWLKSKFQAESG